ncbi:hypothetical protein Godav_011673, partial [Gossypium davidsonii]|nr:hypothetical protein [Gossypium davidsonii]
VGLLTIKYFFSHNLRGTKRKWVSKEDAALVACMVDLHNVETFNTNTRFKVDYLNKLEIMLEKVLPRAMLKAKPNLELKIRTLKRDWAIVYTCSVENTITTLVETSIDSLLLNILFIKKPNNLDIEVSLIMTNLLSSTQKIKSLGKMLKQPLILLKK